jgi:hypothetical protein
MDTPPLRCLLSRDTSSMKFFEYSSDKIGLYAFVIFVITLLFGCVSLSLVCYGFYSLIVGTRESCQSFLIITPSAVCLIYSTIWWCVFKYERPRHIYATVSIVIILISLIIGGILSRFTDCIGWCVIELSATSMICVILISLTFWGHTYLQKDSGYEPMDL